MQGTYGRVFGFETVPCFGHDVLSGSTTTYNMRGVFELVRCFCGAVNILLVGYFSSLFIVSPGQQSIVQCVTVLSTEGYVTKFPHQYAQEQLTSLNARLRDLSLFCFM